MFNTTRILLIDEEHAEYLLVGDLLKRVCHTRYQLSWCDRLDYALDEILSDRYDVILLDYYWSGHTSRELLANAQTKGSKVPILVMTEEMETDLDREIIRAGASDYLIKGLVNAQLLERTIRYAIERKAAELKLSQLAHYDILTNVPNRILFRDRLEHALQLAERGQLSFTLMYLDLDGFKQVNDNFGHDAGDALIRACAERLRSCMRKSDLVARIGGDEFTLLLEGTESSKDIAHIAEKVLETVTQPYCIGNHQIFIGCSLGIAVYPDAGKDADSLQKHADMAMYRAKQQEGSTYRFYTEVMNVEVRRQLLLESDLKRAIKRNEFKLHYQPRVDILSGDIIGFEALLRWCHPTRGLMEPGQFIAVAEESGMIIALGYWVLNRACADLKRLQAASTRPLFMAVNFSLRQFRDEKLVARIASILKKVGTGAGRVELELAESTVMENMELVSLCIRALSNLGLSFSLDGFGTGSSSFVHLQRLPISTLKIDRRFIRDITDNAEDQKLVRAMITLAHSLDKRVVAMGVETPEQLELLHQFGCDQIQGHHLSRPLELPDVCQKLEAEAVAL